MAARSQDQVPLGSVIKESRERNLSMESSGDCEFMGHFKFSSPGAKKRRSGGGYVTPSGGSLSSPIHPLLVDRYHLLYISYWWIVIIWRYGAGGGCGILPEAALRSRSTLFGIERVCQRDVGCLK